MATAVLEAREVWKSYRIGKDRDFHALSGVNLRIDQGEYVALMGPSGSGKSTLLHLLGALDLPTRGDVLYRGTAVGGLRDREVARIRGEHVGFVFQSFNLVPRLTAVENVMLPMSFVAGKPGRADRRKRATDLLERVGLGGHLDHTPAELSGGQRQRVSIARALVNDPGIVLADEPTGNLDSKTGREILALFDDLHREGRTLLLVTHDPHVGDRAGRVIRVFDGKLDHRTPGQRAAAEKEVGA